MEIERTDDFYQREERKDIMDRNQGKLPFII